MGVGLAMGERYLAAQFNRPGFELFNHFTYGLVSDGDLMEGISAEAASLAGTQGLGKLIYLYDDNLVTIEGGTDIAFSEDTRNRFLAYGWQVIVVSNGEDLGSVHLALENAQANLEKPTLIMCRTVLGAGSPRAGTSKAHGEPLGPEGLEKTREFYGYGDKPPYFVDERVAKNFLDRIGRNADTRVKWEELLKAYGAAYPKEFAELTRRLEGRVDQEALFSEPIAFPVKPISTRAASGEVLNTLARRAPEILGGSADLGPSNKTELIGLGSFLPLSPTGRNIHFGVREHAMGAIVNGLAIDNGIIPFGATFMAFCDFLRPALRMAALMDLKSIFIFTHDSVCVGEDGPTHQPVEQLASLRIMPNLTVLRPADAFETVALWRGLFDYPGPVAFVLTRQDLPVLDPAVYPSVLTGPQFGGYILQDAANPEAIILATGSEVHVALAAAKLIGDQKRVRVVSLPSWELFDRQPSSYKDTVLPPTVLKRLSVEAGLAIGWNRYLGPEGRSISVETFGRSAKAERIYAALGFTPENVAAKVLELFE
jgi:transketolase